MKYSLSPKTERNLILVGLYQIAGAVVGIGFLFWMLIKMSTPGMATVIFILAAYAFFIFGLVAGWRCVDLRKGAIQFSRINQTLQIFGFSIAGLTYSYSAGLAFGVRLQFIEDVVVHYFINLSTISLSYSTYPGNTHITVNLVPLLLVIFIDWIDRSIRRENNQLIEQLPD